MASGSSNATDFSAVADEHARILQTISDYDSAPAELRDTDELLQSLESNIEARETKLKQLIKNRVAEHKDVDNLQRSRTKRLYVYLKHGGKEGLNKRMEKEEREYIEAAQAEFNETSAIKDLKEAADNAREKKEGLERQVEERKRLLTALDSLYSSAFNGPTPDFPEEDSAETELREAEQHYERQQSSLNQSRHVSNIMQKALATTKQVENSLENANRNGTLDTFGIGGIWAELAERDHLMRAQGLAAHVDMLIRQVQSLTPEVNGLQMPKIVSPEWLNVVFDNLYTDLLFQRKINESLNSVYEFKSNLIQYCRRFESTVEQANNEVKDAAVFLRSKRRELIAVRREILTRVAEDRVDAPPTYGAVANSGAGSISRQLVNMSVTMPSAAAEPPPPAYDVPSASLNRPQYAPPPGPPPNNREAQSPRTSEAVENSPAMTIYQPPPGPPPGDLARPSSRRTLSAASSSTSRSRSLSPHYPRPPPDNELGLHVPSPHAWAKPLPPSPTNPPQALPDIGSPASQTIRRGSPLSSPSPPPLPPTSSRPRTPSLQPTQSSQLNVTSMNFPEPHHEQDDSMHHSPNLGSPWRIEILNSGGDRHFDSSNNDSQFTLPPTANPFLSSLEHSIGTTFSTADQATQPSAQGEGDAGKAQDNAMNARKAANNPFRQNVSSSS